MTFPSVLLAVKIPEVHNFNSLKSGCESNGRKTRSGRDRRISDLRLPDKLFSRVILQSSGSCIRTEEVPNHSAGLLVLRKTPHCLDCPALSLPCG